MKVKPHKLGTFVRWEDNKGALRAVFKLPRNDRESPPIQLGTLQHIFSTADLTQYDKDQYGLAMSKLNKPSP